jgi:hypothetical protein
MRTKLDELMGEWGAWKRRENANRLGYPTEAAFAKDKVDHGGWGSVDPDVPMVDDDLRRADAAVNSLHANGRLMMIAHYIWPGPAKTKAHKLGMSIAQYYFRLGPFQEQVAHVLGGAYLNGYEEIIISSRDLVEVSR